MTTPLTRARRLRPGDTVRLVAPSGPPKAGAVAAGIAELESWGLVVQCPDRIFDGRGYLAGDDEARAAELVEALADPDVAGIFCARGGYGAGRMVDLVDFETARHNPKPVVGYSDITVLHQALYVRAGLAGVHGPVVTTFAAGHGRGTAEALRNAVMTADPVTVEVREDEPGTVLTCGEAPVSGPLLGGNLSLVVDAVGTSTCPDYAGAIVFLEEVNEEPYRVDRMLTQLRRSGVFEGVAGFALGQFTDCADSDWDVTVEDVLRDLLGAFGVPILGGLPLGHGPDPMTVPFGTVATLDPVAGRLTVESAVA
ncbi:muramoyltetrapeptide carboxypeptidase [Stackebrandtia albiflava]|uniref:Muramoyltetrapeptide carboxypeptidase n=1 Tax=Stackebrandtia albiflava TaxID=406432 RepID=A0A562UQI0_9ACTN|nr:LD-carboxypeptidase [Stackebrandtia albiflava]TWJ07885.1 muramoyltetrapeptide carboxypeptidase [Stackebrandtia albiflava]